MSNVIDCHIDNVREVVSDFVTEVSYTYDVQVERFIKYAEQTRQFVEAGFTISLADPKIGIVINIHGDN